MRSMLLIFGLMLGVFSAQAQYMGVWFYGGASVFGVANGGTRGRTFEAFRQSYNDLNRANLSKELSKRSILPGANYGMAFGFGLFYGEVGYLTAHSRSTATYTDGTKNTLNFRQNDVNVGLGMGYFNPYFYVTTVFGMDAGFSDKLIATTETADGSTILGSIRPLNGEYQGTRISSYYGIRAGFGRWVKVFVAADMLRSSGEFGIYDMTTGGADINQIGIDWAAFTADPLTYALSDGEFLRSGFDGLVVRVGLQIDLVNNDN